MSCECKALIVANIHLKQGIRNHFAVKSVFQLCSYFESSHVKYKLILEILYGMSFLKKSGF